MSLSKFIEEKFGQKTRSYQNPEITEVETTVTRVLKNNPDRLAYTFINLGANSVYLAWDRQVADDRGILIASGGGSITLSADEDGELVGYELFGIADTANAACFVVVTEGA